MITRKRQYTTALAALCALLILSCTLVIAVPHSHEGYEPDCVICTVSKLSVDGFLSLVISAALILSILGQCSAILEPDLAPSAREGTPVWLKDKLSN